MNTTENMTNQRVTTSASLGSTLAVSHAGLLQRARWGYQIIIKGVFATLIFPIIVTLSMMLTTSNALGFAMKVGTIPDQTLTLAGGVQTVDVYRFFTDPETAYANSRDLSYSWKVKLGETKGLVRIAITRGVLTITPVAVGRTVIEIYARGRSAGPGSVAKQYFTVTVGDTPVGTIADQTLTVADGTQSLTVTSNFADADVTDSTNLTYTAMSATEAIATVSITDVGVLTITPVAAGTSVITVTAQDGSNAEVSQTLIVTVGDSPTTFSQIPELESGRLTRANGAVRITLSDFFADADVDSANLIYTATAGRRVMVRIDNDVLIITPVRLGPASDITVTAQDGTNPPVSQTFAAPVSDSPTIPTQIDDQSQLLAGGAVVEITLSDFFADADVPNSPDLFYTATSATPAIATVSVTEVGLLTITPVAVGTSEITVTAKNGTGSAAVASQTFMMTFSSIAGVDQTVDEGARVMLEGSVTGADLTYDWTQSGGTNVALTGANTINPSFTAPNHLSAPVDLTFELTVSGGAAGNVIGNVTVTVQDNAPPSISLVGASSVTVIAAGGMIAPINIDASAGGVVDSYTISPDIGNGLLFDTATGTISGIPTAVANAITYTITATNDNGVDTVRVSITSSSFTNPPVANAGVDQSVSAGIDVTVTLTGSASTGVDLTYAWTQTGGTDVTLTDADTTLPSFIVPPLFGADIAVLMFELLVTDDRGVTSSDGVNVTVRASGALVITGTPDDTAVVGVAYRFAPTGAGTSSGIATTRYSISSTSPLPSWLNFNTTNGVLSGTPALGDVGATRGIVITVTISVAFGSGSSRSASLPAFDLDVVSNETIPFGIIPDQTLTLAGGTVTIDVSDNFTDPNVADSASLTYTVTSASTNSVTVSINAVGVLTITPVTVGTSVITVTAQDGTNTPATQTFTVTVPAFDLDVDENGEVTVLDGLMIIRYIGGTKEGRDLTAGLSDVADPNPVADKIKRGIGGLLDVDENGAVTVLDGLMIIRYIGGTKEGEGLTAGLSDVDNPAIVATNIAELIPSAPSTY